LRTECSMCFLQGHNNILMFWRSSSSSLRTHWRITYNARQQISRGKESHRPASDIILTFFPKIELTKRLTELVVHLKFFSRINTYLKLFTVLWLCASLFIPVKTQNVRPYMAAILVNGLCNIVLTGWREATLEDKSVVPNSVRYHRITVVNTCVSGDS